jgi:hypothetical protein
VRLIAEAEDFAVTHGAWRVVPYRENYFASTFAITFLSRMACLGAPAQVAQDAVAEERISVPVDGEFQVLARYEQPFDFSAEFTLEIEQSGHTLLSQPFGRLQDPKIWAFNKHQRVPMERYWWGSTENIVWQQAGPVRLARGEARLRLIARAQLENGVQRVKAAERHVDAIVLTNDLAGLEAQKKAAYLELDGWLVQDGDLYVRFTNPADGRGPLLPLVEPFNQGQHSPYYVHVRDWPTTRVLKSGRLPSREDYALAGPHSDAVKPGLVGPLLDPSRFSAIPAAEYLGPGETSAWVPLGQALDALNDSLWLPRAIYLNAAKNDRAIDLVAEFAVPDGKGGLRSIRTLRLQGTPEALSPIALEIPGNVRTRPVIRSALEALQGLNAEVAKWTTPSPAPRRFPIYGLLDFSGALANPGPIGEQATRLALALGDDTMTPASGPWAAKLGVPERRTGIVTHWHLGQVEKGYAAADKDGRARSIGIVSYGDEIRIEARTPAAGDETAFKTWLAARGVSGPSAAHLTDDPADPWFYYGRLWGYETQMATYADATRFLESKLGPGVLTGINYSPHANYLVSDLQWVRPFKVGALKLPWSEDYAWQIPEFSPQVTGYLVSALRAGSKYHDLPILMYVMPHSPGNTPRDFRLSFYAAVAHGARMIHYFCATPLAVGQTENYIATDDLAMWRAVFDTTHDAGGFEDYVVDSRVRPARVGLLLSSVDEIRTGDANDKGGIHNQERKAVYYALRHAQVAVDFVSEDDVIEGRAKGLDLIYVTQQFLHSKAVEALTRWVDAGGTLVALAGGGFLDEFGRNDPASHALYGVAEQQFLKDPALPMVLAKQDLPGLKPLDEASWGDVSAPVLVWKQGLRPSDGKVLGTFHDGKPAVIEKAHGKGRAVLFGFFPGMAYLKSGLPLRPVDRGATDAGFNHFLPTAMDAGLRRALVDAFLPSDFVRPVETSQPLVEATLLETPALHRLAVPLMNYTGAALPALRVTLRGLGAIRSVRSLAHGALQAQSRDGAVLITLPLDVADMLLVDR